MEKQDYSKMLIEYRGKKGLRQRDIAEKLGVSIPTICNIENGKQYPNATTRYKIKELVWGDLSDEDFDE